MKITIDAITVEADTHDELIRLARLISPWRPWILREKAATPGELSPEAADALLEIIDP